MTNLTPQTHRSTAIIVKLIWLTPVVVMTLVVAACSKISEKVFDSRLSEGIIEYRISFPELSDESITATLLPETMTYAFNENAFASYFEAAGGVFKNRIKADRNDMSVEHELKVFKKKIRVMMNETEVMRMLADYPKMTFIETSDTTSIAGFLCHKALIVFEDPSIPEIDVFYTKDIKMVKPNWCTQYHEIDGVLMAYEVEEFGVRMRLEATSVTAAEVDEIMNQSGTDYQNISREAMDVELAQLVETFEL